MVASLWLATLLTATAATPPASLPFPLCSPAQLRLPEWQGDPRAHMRFPEPLARYPTGTQRRPWGLPVQVRVEADGRVACLLPDDVDQQPVEWTPQRIEALRRLAAARFEPFLRDGSPATVRVPLFLREEEAPPPGPPAPKVPLDQARIVLERGVCMGTCPVYKVEIHGDGRVRYTGQAFVAVSGVQDYRIAKRTVAALVRRMSEGDAWFAREHYYGMDDVPTVTLTLSLGTSTRRVSGTGGLLVGMPAEIDAFARAVDEAAGTQHWVRLDQETLRALQDQRFDFGSLQGSDLFLCAIADEETDEAAILRLLELGASPTQRAEGCEFATESQSPLEAALLHGRDGVLARLVEQGALRAELTSQARVDELFLLALRGGRLAGVQQLWNGAAPLRPSAWRLEPSPVQGREAMREPILFDLSNDPYEPGRWQAASIVEWLAAQGLDPKVRRQTGATLLHEAASNADVATVRVLLRLGVDPGLRTDSGRLALDWAESDAVAVALLEATPGAAADAALRKNLRDKAEERLWPSTLGWLESHPRQVGPPRRPW